MLTWEPEIDETIARRQVGSSPATSGSSRRQPPEVSKDRAHGQHRGLIGLRQGAPGGLEIAPDVRN